MCSKTFREYLYEQIFRTFLEYPELKQFLKG